MRPSEAWQSVFEVCCSRGFITGLQLSDPHWVCCPANAGIGAIARRFQSESRTGSTFHAPGVIAPLDRVATTAPF